MKIEKTSGFIRNLLLMLLLFKFLSIFNFVFFIFFRIFSHSNLSTSTKNKRADVEDSIAAIGFAIRRLTKIVTGFSCSICASKSSCFWFEMSRVRWPNWDLVVNLLCCFFFFSLVVCQRHQANKSRLRRSFHFVSYILLLRCNILMSHDENLITFEDNLQFKLVMMRSISLVAWLFLFLSFVFRLFNVELAWANRTTSKCMRPTKCRFRYDRVCVIIYSRLFDFTFGAVIDMKNGIFLLAMNNEHVLFPIFFRVPVKSNKTNKKYHTKSSHIALDSCFSFFYHYFSVCLPMTNDESE